MAMSSWLEIAAESGFSIHNIPFGIISHAQHAEPRVGIAFGEWALDLAIFAAGNGFSRLSTIQPHQKVFSASTLNAFAALGKPMHSAVRKYIQSVLLQDTPFPDVLKDNRDLCSRALIPREHVKTHLPMRITDYTDFYAGMNHAFNVGVLFRGADNALQPNYKHLPVGYHGRASSVVVSGTPIRRPHGQILANPGDKVPSFGQSRKLDIELELGAFLCRETPLGQPVSIKDAEDHIFGYVLLNDWSARDIQAWEYVPLGPFNGKNFGTTISPWVVLTEALEPFRTVGLENDTELLPYLREDAKAFYNIDLEVELTTASGASAQIAQVKGDNLIFSFPQMLAHHTVGGCPTNVGDLLGSGTISGKGVSERGSLLEQNENGRMEISIGAEQRRFLEDGDTVVLRGTCRGSNGVLVGFGECSGVISPAIDGMFWCPSPAPESNERREAKRNHLSNRERRSE